MGSYTPGPWRMEDEEGHFGIFAGEALLAVTVPDDTPDRRVRRGNAMLMAAAPALLNACRRVNELLENNRVVTAEGFLINDLDIRAVLTDALMRAEGYRVEPVPTDASGA